jgi:hypothetical protein
MQCSTAQSGSAAQYNQAVNPTEWNRSDIAVAEQNRTEQNGIEQSRTEQNGIEQSSRAKYTIGQNIPESR